MPFDDGRAASSRTGKPYHDRNSRTWDSEGTHYYDFVMVAAFTDKDARDESITSLKSEGFKTKIITYTSPYGDKEYAIYAARSCTCTDFGKKHHCLVNSMIRWY